jgi:hypothetical protein
MQQHGIAPFQPHQDVLAAPTETGDACAGQPLLQALGQWPAQVRPVRQRMHDRAALQPPAEATHHGLDFGEFRHGAAARYRCAG